MIFSFKMDFVETVKDKLSVMNDNYVAAQVKSRILPI